MELDPQSLSVADRYKLLIGGIIPRPIAAVSTLSPGGLPNLAPFSFFAGVGSDPMTLLFCPATRPDGGEKDTLRNCKPIADGGTGEFVVCVVTESLVRRMSAAAEPLAHGESEFDFAGLESVPSVKVRPGRVRGSPLAFECRTIQVVRTMPGRPSSGNIVIGEVVHVYADDAALFDRVKINPDAVAAVGRMGGHSYTRTRERFDLPVGSPALEAPEPFIL